jgi:nucleoid-associated protein YgaU
MPRTTDPDSLSLKPSSATLRGERVRPDFSGVRGSADTVPATSAGQRYTIKAGDTLSHIAQRYYGNASDWRRIYEANRGTIENPDLIHPGQEITIPPANGS